MGGQNTTGEGEHSPMVTHTTQNSAGFCSEDREESQTDDWQVPDKWRRLSQMVFCCGYLEIHVQNVYQDPVLKRFKVVFIKF